ncbi:hypothetical protein BT96DRAFT_949567 [Gymnopus androsaceus JB14]|uniref:Uncharacterized protein n=1 Tax=Gymnopus androsaceus JB14 TaxID=1447944 RepID=A0A6A4GKR9_9AGAR|nr:hypothetical protein BT96DRAFT_949567 [Gymnopus androsaceus JB14]
MFSVSQSGEEPVFLLDTKTPIQSDPISTRIPATVTAKSTSNSPFIAPVELLVTSRPILSEQTNLHKNEWHIAIAAAGYSYLFNTSFIPLTSPENPEAPGYIAELTIFQSYTQLKSQARSLLTACLDDRLTCKVTKESTQVLDIWVKLVVQLQVKLVIAISNMKADWEQHTCGPKVNLIDFLAEDQEMVDKIEGAGGQLSDSKFRAHILKVIPATYKDYINTMLKMAN